MPALLPVPPSPFQPVVKTTDPAGSQTDQLVRVTVAGIVTPSVGPARNQYFSFTLYNSTGISTDNFAALHAALIGSTAYVSWISALVKLLNQEFVCTSVSYCDILNPMAKSVKIAYTQAGLVSTAALPTGDVIDINFSTPFLPLGKSRITLSPVSAANLASGGGDSVLAGSITAFEAVFNATPHTAGAKTLSDGTNIWQLCVSSTGGTRRVRESQKKLTFNYVSQSWQSKTGGVVAAIVQPVDTIYCSAIIGHRRSRQVKSRKASRNPAARYAAMIRGMRAMQETQRLDAQPRDMRRISQQAQQQEYAPLRLPYDDPNYPGYGSGGN